MLAGIACWCVLQSTFKLLELMGIQRPSFEPCNADEMDTSNSDGEDKHDEEDLGDTNESSNSCEDDNAEGV